MSSAVMNIGEPSPRLTAGDLSRYLEVDLKTIHNWVGRGKIVGRRTAGRHLRFTRTEVVRFLRRSGRFVPREVALMSPRVIAAGLSDTELADARLSQALCVDIYSALLDFATADYDVLVVNLRRLDAASAHELAESIRNNHKTLDLALVGVGVADAVREAFARAGADVTVPDSTQLGPAIQWVSGS